ncbi:MAG: hypothetical protein AAF899_04515 [Pseudomonadota bacterium]
MVRRLSMAAFVMAVTTAGAAAQDLTYNLTAEVEPVCGAFSSAADADGAQDKDFGVLSDIDTSTQVTATGGGGSITYVCNAPGGFTRTISSQNNGFLFREGTVGGGEDQIAYTVQHGGGSGLSFAERQLTAPEVSIFSGAPAFVEGQTGSITFRTFGVRETTTNDAVATTVRAGTYTDVVTVAITAN